MELIYTNREEVPQDGSEYFPIVTPEGIVTGMASRKKCHDGSKLNLHPVVHLHVFNEKGELYMQKRSLSKDIQPGKWDTAVGGHVDYGESIAQALAREAREELSIEQILPRFLFSYVYVSDKEREMVNAFAVTYNGPILADPGEISDSRFWTMDEIRNNLGKYVFTPNFEHEFAMLEKQFQKK